MPDDTTITFLPWASTQAGAARTGAGTNRDPVTISLHITARPAAGGTDTVRDVQAEVNLIGPGDVTGIDIGQVLRTEPVDGAVDVETTLFPTIDFDLPNLPWMLSTDKPAGPKLAPWLTLIVVADSVSVTVDTARRLIILPRTELPDLTDNWAWAHVQCPGPMPGVTSSEAASLIDSTTGSLSRLIGPRVLAPHTRYHACVVPATTVGQQAALGGTPGPTEKCIFGWPDGDPVTLPFYHRFSFTTGDAGDFASLAARLTASASASPITLASRLLSTTWADPAAGTQTASEPMPSVISPTVSPSATGADPRPWLTGEITPVLSPPEVTPPVYGSTQAGLTAADLHTALTANQATLPKWLLELNTDPRLRVAAGLGTQVVAAEQEDLVAAAFTQVGQIAAVNTQLERGRLARAVRDTTVAKHLTGHDPLTTVQLLGPIASRLQLNPGGTANTAGSAANLIAQAAATTPALPAKAGVAYRRMTRGRGPIARHTAAPPPAPLPGTLAPATLLAPLTSQPSQPNDRILLEYVSPPTRTLAAGNNDTLRSLAPPVEFPTAMLGPLINLDPDAVLPGASTMPPNSALLLGDDPAVIRSYLVGLNHAAARLLQWRGVATDRRATPFRSFWGTGSQDIDPISAWPTTQSLTDTAGQSQAVLAIRADLFQRYPNTTVYAVQATSTNPPHFPTVDPDNPGQLGPAATPPLFSAIIPPDVRLFIFAIPLSAMTEPPGWYLVFQEQVTETRFGSDNLTAIPVSGYCTTTELAAQGATDAGKIAALLRIKPSLVAIAASRLRPATGPPA